MQHRCLIVALVALIAHAFEGNAQGGLPLQARLDRMFVPWTKGNVPGCAAGVIQAGRWLARGGYGSASLEHGVRITPDTVFYSGSVSKQFTAAAVLRLVDQGKASLDDDIRRHLPELPEYTPPITIRHLVHQTTGLRDYFQLIGESGKDVHGRISPEEILAMVVKETPEFAAGLIHRYSNTHYFLLGEIVHRASGKSLRDFARETLFEPLGMKDTRYFDDPTEVVPRYASGYFEEGRGRYRVVRTLYSQVGAGGLLTTVNDLGKWTRVFSDANAIPASPRLGERLLERGTLSDGTPTDYAFGLVHEREHGVATAWHNGFFPGYVSTFTWIPERRMGVFELCNWSGAPSTTLRANLVTEALR